MHSTWRERNVVKTFRVVVIVVGLILVSSWGYCGDIRSCCCCFRGSFRSSALPKAAFRYVLLSLLLLSVVW